MFSSKVNQIDINDLAESVVEFYFSHLSQIRDFVDHDLNDDEESVVELVCLLKSPGHMSRREIQALKSRVHGKLPVSGSICANQYRKNGQWYVDIITPVIPESVHKM